MKIYDTIKEIIDVNIFYCLIPLLIFIIFVEIFFKNRFKTKQVLNLVRWFIISYFIIGFVHYMIGLAFFPKEFAFLNRATGPYKFAYWLMFFLAAIVPFTLFYKKLALKPFYLIFIILNMKIGWYFEHFVIIVTSYHSDYSPYNDSSDLLTSWMKAILMQTLQGFILAIIVLGFFEFIEKRKATHNN